MQLKKRQIAFLLFLIVATAFILLNRNSLTRATFRTAEGSIFGTTYHIKYEAAQPLDSLILDTLRRVDNFRFSISKARSAASTGARPCRLTRCWQR